MFLILSSPKYLEPIVHNISPPSLVLSPSDPVPNQLLLTLQVVQEPGLKFIVFPLFEIFPT